MVDQQVTLSTSLRVSSSIMMATLISPSLGRHYSSPLTGPVYKHACRPHLRMVKPQTSGSGHPNRNDASDVPGCDQIRPTEHNNDGAT